jgi:hypothetical protein
MPVTRLILLLGIVIISFNRPAEAAINCTATGTMNFGTVDVLTGAASSVTPSTISISCTGANPNTVVAAVCVSLGPGTSTSWPPREMISGGNRLKFEIYKDAALTSVMGSWPFFTTAYSGATTGLLVNVPITSGSGSESFTLYGVVLGSQQSVPSGAYTASFTDASSTLMAFQSPNFNTQQNCASNAGGGQPSGLSHSNRNSDAKLRDQREQSQLRHDHQSLRANRCSIHHQHHLRIGIALFRHSFGRLFKCKQSGCAKDAVRRESSNLWAL